MPPKNKIGNTEAQKQFTARIHDWIDQSVVRCKSVVSPFLDEAQQVQVDRICGKRIETIKDGGYPDAQRVRVVFVYQSQYESEVVCLTACIQQKFVQLTHRDVLGALMALDLDRSQFGDCFVLEDRIVVYCSASIAKYVSINCTQIHRLPVHFEVSNTTYQPNQQFAILNINIASLRLDNVVGALLGCSRNIASQYIESGQVKVNHEKIEDCKRLCHNDDTISIAKIGRFKILDGLKVTRKNRFVIEVKKYL